MADFGLHIEPRARWASSASARCRGSVRCSVVMLGPFYSLLAQTGRTCGFEKKCPNGFRRSGLLMVCRIMLRLH